ncbi:glycosyltransferase [Empedobacter sp.]|uniref:glycosyltransferase family 2 protein n=1 Tax=Empedobacter sp. TaxID=1927715 RepID=UPI0028A789C7|nr:glycosyltransferase [Empedobacter sp.]
MSKLLSIIIPTRNRGKYCISVIETILKNKNENFEVVVQDNSNDNELENYFSKNISDDRLQYSYISEPLSFIENFNKAIDSANGKYVIIIGDDDGITKNIFPLVEWANKNNVDSICPVELIHYVWPNEDTNGKMVIPYSTKKVWTNKPLSNMQDLVEDGIIQYMHFNIPKLYHGIILKERLLEIQNKTGAFFAGLTPDIYASIALSKVVKKHVVIDFPITIAGACPKSATIDNTKGKHSGKLENAPHFNNRGDYQWDKRVPNYYSVQTIWAETAIKAMEDMDIEVDLSKLNLEKMLAGALIDSTNYQDFFIDETLKLRPNLSRIDVLKKVNQLKKKLYYKGLIKRIIGRVPRKYLYRNIRLTNITDINICTNVSNKELDKYNIVEILNAYNKEERKI